MRWRTTQESPSLVASPGRKQIQTGAQVGTERPRFDPRQPSTRQVPVELRLLETRQQQLQ